MQLATFLKLSPEFGGTKFGPFQGVEIRLGSDPDTNDISLPEALGVSPQHVKVLQQGEHNYIVAPVDRTATVYIWRENSNKPKQITTPMAVKKGDGFSLVTPEGPRFYILQEELHKERNVVGGTFAEKAMKRMPTSRGLLEEIKRRGLAKVFSTKIGNFVMYGYRFVVTGQIFNPVYVVAGIMILSGWLFAGGASCTACSVNSTKNEYQAKYTNCENQRMGNAAGEDSKPSIPNLTRSILVDNEWATTLRDDRDFYPMFASELDSAFSRGEEFKWVYQNDKTKVAQFRRNLASLPPNLTSTLAFLAAHPSRIGAREWQVVVDSEGEEVCGRGPLGLTYRQAVRLGLANVQLDALVTNTFALSQDVDKKRETLLKTADFIPEPMSMDGRVIAQTGGIVDQGQGARECMHVEGVDDRDDLSALSARIGVELGSSTKGLPPENGPYWVAQRLMKLGAMDFKFGYENLKFNLAGKTPTQTLANQDVTQKRREFAARWAGRVAANAVVSRCMLVFDKEFSDAPPDYLGPPPDLAQCAVVKAFVEYGRL